MWNYYLSECFTKTKSVPMRLVPFSLVVSKTFVSLPFLTAVACAIAAVLEAASTITYRPIQRKKTANKS